MRNFLTQFAGMLMLIGMAGCGGNNHPQLYSPGATQVWPKVDSKEMAQYRDSLTKVELVTSLGPIVFELYADKAPLTVANFLKYVETGFYAGTVFHRVEPGMVVQGGGFTTDMVKKETLPPIPNEAGNGLRNVRGSVGLARTMEMVSGTAQFYINLVDNTAFNGDGVTGGYAVFGRVLSGMDVVDSMARLETRTVSGMAGVPVEPVVILSVRVLE